MSETIDERIDRLHGPGAAAALDASIADGSVFGQDRVMEVFVLSERGDHYDGGDQVLGVFSSRDAAMASLPSESWASCSDERHGELFETIAVEPGFVLPPGWTRLHTTDHRYDIEPWTVDELTVAPFASR